MDGNVEWKRGIGMNGYMITRFVRCKDCMHFEPSNAEEGDSSGHCRNRYSICQNALTDMDWYCADAERKDDE